MPLKQPVLNGQVFGSDSVLNAVYRGKVYWFWGDTNRPSYPLGNFHVPGRHLRTAGPGRARSGNRIDLTYFLDAKGFARRRPGCPARGRPG